MTWGNVVAKLRMRGTAHCPAGCRTGPPGQQPGRVLGSSCSRGWVTPRVGGGVDFVSRLDLGSGFCKASVVVLGQAKCIKPGTSVQGIDLARTVARLKRGWIGAVVTTGTFSNRAQQELLTDQYPSVMINGARLAQEVRAEMASTGLTLANVLHRESEWYHANQRMLAADRIVFGDHWGVTTGKTTPVLGGQV